MISSFDRPWVHIAVHKLARELDAKVWLATNLVGRGFNVTIGRTGPIRALVHQLPKGIYIDVRFLKTRKWVFEKFRDAGHKVVAFDEEATSFPDEHYYRKNLVCPETLSLCDAAFCWGPYHATAVSQSLTTDNASIIKVTGHPRFDLLRLPQRGFYDADVSKLRRAHGRFFLLNSNAGGWVLDGAFEQTWQDYISRRILDDTPEERRAFIAKYRHRTERQRHMSDLAAAVARAYPDIKLIIRPHFTETDAQWKRWLPAGLGNIQIEHSGSAIPWMLASQAVIHNSCTTGTEAFLADVPVIAYRPVRDDRYDAELPNRLSVEVRNETEAISFLGGILTDATKPMESGEEARNQLFDSIMSGRTGPSAAERITNELERLAFADGSNEQRVDHLLRKARRAKHGRAIKRRLDKLLGRARARGVRETEIVAADIRERIGKIRPFCNGARSICVEEIAGEVFFLTHDDRQARWSEQ